MKPLFLFFAIAAFILLTRCTVQPGGNPPEPTPPDLGKPTAPCFEPGTYEAVDMSVPADEAFVKLMVQHKVKTVIRYYDWVQESIKGKTPKAEELALFKKYGLKTMAVFQHYNSSYSTFTDPSRPAKDLARILELAKLWGQPKGSAAYVGVDGDFWTKEQKEAVSKYFRPIAFGLQAAGYRVGMYGSGANCENLADLGLISRVDGKPLCMIAGSSGWSRTKEVLASGKYALKQRVHQKCGGKELDYNTVNVPDFGQWAIP